MLVCTKCHMEYEEGEDFCSSCGGPLVTKKEPTPGHEDKQKTEEVKPDGRLICPKCKILYERMKPCVRCGGPLVKYTPSQEKEEPGASRALEDKKGESKAASPSEVIKEPSQVQPPEKRPIEPTREEPKPFPKPEVKKEPPPIEPPEKGPTKKLPEDMGRSVTPSAKSKWNFLRSFPGSISIIILIAAALYFLWSQYSHFTTKRPVPGPVSSEQATVPSGTSTPADRAATVGEPQEKVSSPSETWELEKIKDLLEKIRRANFRKDIDLFMSCYSTDFKDREGRERATLKTWEMFNYLNLSYDLKTHSISGDTAKIRVEWLMKISPRTGGRPQESKTVIDAILKKEDNDWKIKEVTPVS